MAYPGAGGDTRDVYVPAKLLAELGSPTTSSDIPARSTIVQGNRQTNSSSVHANYCADVQALHEAYPPNGSSVTGDVAEVVKVHYRLRHRANR